MGDEDGGVHHPPLTDTGLRRGKGYLAEMAFFPRPVGPVRAIGDLWQFLKARKPHEYIILLASIGMTFTWFAAIFYKLYPKPEYKPPTVMYVKQWTAARTAADVRAQQAKDLPAELEAKKAAEKAEAEKRAKYQRLAKQLGID